MEFSEDLKLLMQKSSGIITTAKANKKGISNERLRLLVKQGKLARIQHGVYILADEIADELYIAQKRRSKMIYSHETALYLHDLTDRDPINYSVTVPTGYGTTKLRAEGFKVFNIKRDLYEVGLTTVNTIFGNPVKTYDKERTICDCLRSRSQLDIYIVTEAVRRYSRLRDKDLNKLMNMAEKFGVEKLVRNYLEVLL